MANDLLNRLREKDKKGLFKSSQNSVVYRTGFLPLDYRNGYMLEIRDMKDKLVDMIPSVGLVGGTFVTVIGKSGVAKTTWSVQAAYNMVKDFPDNAFVIHYDLEQATNYTRVRNITGASSIELQDKYIIRQEKNYLEDIFDSLIQIANEKEANKKEYIYDTKTVDEFNQPVYAYVPTVVLIDSLPSLASRDMDEEEMKGQTDSMRMAQKVKQFYKKLLPIIKTYNITVISINHINQKVEVSAFAKTQPQVMYLKMDESLPGGNAPIYFANTLIKFISAGKKNKADDGFDGFVVRAELLKSRTNKAGQFCHLVYNQLTGFDPILTLYQFAEDNDLLDGRNPYKYFKGYKDVKFDSRKFRQAFNDNKEIRNTLMKVCEPYLNDLLSRVDDDEKEMSKSDITAAFIESQENDE